MSDVGGTPTNRGDEWAVCPSCGKERQVWRKHAENADLYRLRVKLAEHSACRKCEAEANRAMDSCPEAVAIPGGVSGCRLGWAHSGRCEPHPPTPLTVLADLLRRQP